jgi:hypothetical protein
MTNYKVELIYTSDPYTKLKSGDVGELIRSRQDPYEKQIRILDVKWESGSTLSLIEGQDEWRVYEETQ